MSLRPDFPIHFSIIEFVYENYSTKLQARFKLHPFHFICNHLFFLITRYLSEYSTNKDYDMHYLQEWQGSTHLSYLFSPIRFKNMYVLYISGHNCSVHSSCYLAQLLPFKNSARCSIIIAISQPRTCSSVHQLCSSLPDVYRHRRRAWLNSSWISAPPPSPPWP